jgi:DNA (cytosine-5)-methyltransferase 1
MCLIASARCGISSEISLRGEANGAEGKGSPDCRNYFAYDLGAPQHRHRIFIVAFRKSTRRLDWPEVANKQDRPTLRDAISDLPPLEGGWNEGTPAYSGPRTQLQRLMRERFAEDDLRLSDHVTRAVRKDDLMAFKSLKAKDRYSKVPEELRRYGADSFTDKYNRLPWDEPCRTITAHIAKDGYWYIHPEQDRSLSIREAARVQSFPDWFRFAGFRTNAFRQIGEAVPPFVAERLVNKIMEHLVDCSGTDGRTVKRKIRRDKHLRVRQFLRSWYRREAKSNSLHPWRLQSGLWPNLMGEVLFADRGPRRKAILYWGNYIRDWPDPRSFLKDRLRQSHLRTIGLDAKLPVLESLARHLASRRVPALKDLLDLGVSERLARRAMAISGHSRERPNDPALIRQAIRVFERKGFREDSVQSQVTTAMLVGEDEGAVLYTAAIELGETLCSTSEPACMLCPISDLCAHYAAER